jgi:pyrimidine-nucleoside phosphorylase
MHVKLGDRIEVGQPLVTLFAADPALLREPEELLRDNIKISGEPAPIPPLVHEVVTAESANQFLPP